MPWMYLLSNRAVWAALGVVGLIASHLVAYNAGWFRGAASERAVWQVERMQIVQDAERAAAKLRDDGRRIAADLEVAKATIRTEYVDRIVTIRETASATRACFTRRTTDALNATAETDRLNRETPIRERVERPGAPPEVVEHRPPPEGGTSELAAAEWVAGAQRAHAECRGQVSALVDWIKSATGGRP